MTKLNDERAASYEDGGDRNNRVISIEFDARLRIDSAIDEAALRETYGGDLLRCVKTLVDEEGMLGCVDVCDSSTIIAAREY